MATATRTSGAQRVRDRVEAGYLRRTSRSGWLHGQATESLPGGDTRTIAFHRPYPLAIVKGTGATLTDADGNEYLDFLNNYTSLIHGHAHPAIVAAATAQLEKGTAFAAFSTTQSELAEILCERVESLAAVRFCNSGTEATMNAVRAARALTGRDLLVKMEGGYHGSYDAVEVSVHPEAPAAGPAGAPVPVVEGRGLTRGATADTAVLPFNDAGAAERLFAARGSEVAAVIVEPVMGSGGMIPATRDYLLRLRALTAAHGALLIFDEVMAFRVARGGAQAHFGVTPDLTTFAKIIGGGFPVGAFGGNAEVMRQYDPRQGSHLWQSGTFNGNPVTMVAGAAAMRELTDGAFARLSQLGARLRSGLEQAGRDAGVPVVATGLASLVNLHLTGRSVTDYRGAAASDRAELEILHLSLLNRGIFAAPRGMFNISTPMTEADVDRALEAVGGALAEVRAARH